MTRSRPIRYGITALIVLVIGALFVQRELRGGDGGDLGLLETGAIAVGSPAPDFVLEDLAGNRVRLSDFRGKTVVLNFWATWCPPCRAEMPDFQATFEQRRPRDDFVVLAVDRLAEDDRAAVERFVEDFGLAFPVLLDATDEVVRHYGVPGLPSTFFIDRDGVLRARNLGPVFGDVLPQGIAAADAAGGPVRD